MEENHHLTFALERPGASSDNGNWYEEIETRDMKAHFSLPDLSAEYHFGGEWGYVELAGIVRYIEWDDLTQDDAIDLSDNATGWGLNLSTNLKVGPNGSTIRASYLHGEGVENYMNDATSDIGVIHDAANAVQPFQGELIPVTGVVLFYDLNWNEKWTTIPVIRGAFGGGTPLLVAGLYDIHSFGSLWTLGAEARKYLRFGMGKVRRGVL
jgi:hypothetical protein